MGAHVGESVNKKQESHKSKKHKPTLIGSHIHSFYCKDTKAADCHFHVKVKKYVDDSENTTLRAKVTQVM